MAFLDNSGDIILDAVLTDTGRFRLAKGDGSFKIVKFALSDDEINYGLYDKNNLSGSAYYDLEILQTPIFEAFTNNASTMNYKLLSLPRTNLLYLPVMAINNSPASDSQSELFSATQGYVVWTTTLTADKQSVSGQQNGSWNGEAPQQGSNKIRIDQGINNVALPWDATIDQDLKETQYIIEMDSRLGLICSPDDNTPANISYIDDDSIASYYVDDSTPGGYVDAVSDGTLGWTQGASGATKPDGLVIAGPQGTVLQFRIKSTLETRSSNYLFTTIGNQLTNVGASGLNAGTYFYIDTMVKVTGATTGYRLNLPVRFIKCTSC